MADEIPKLVISTGEHLASRALGEQGPATDSWELSSPIPGVRIINTWQVYQLIWLALVKDEAGHYQIFRSIDLHNYTLVHDHATEIYNLFWVDDGHMIFCASSLMIGMDSASEGFMIPMFMVRWVSRPKISASSSAMVPST